MKEGKVYRLIPTLRQQFIDENSNNEHMVNLIEEGGGTFTVLDTSFCDGSFVNKIRTKNGEIYRSDDSGDDYFELCSEEFCYFEEVVEGSEVSNNGGLISMTIEVNQNNFEAMIDLIKKNFIK
ncbi:hypothetical protein AU156_gp189 [Edwardsiella phage PEi20]|uniref:Frd2 domain-containing protein n=1 Tax=Edwardsiella phage PEi20 TaxID=1608310 RepID=A0A0B6VLC6_9CAUD|nr:hypothetical protein AU156_gp189 [Edwardsiella phage PEi20]BAQ22912.1 conserved hypothetical protein [Edwardsiella phage PEi20]